MNLPKVTVIIPAYNNWRHLSACIDSCAVHVADRYAVVIVDDCSDEPGFKERVKEAISNRPNFRYFRMDRNRGFVKTCNYAASELADPESDILLLNSDTVVTAGFLEEMLACLYAGEHHGVCSPRTDNATLCTIPVLFAGKSENFRQVSHACWLKLQGSLPRYSVIPTGIGFCLLIRRSLISRFGFFDERYGRGFNEENDFCSRINRYGYSAVMANRAYVFHECGGSFESKEKKHLERLNRRKLFRKYPEYPRAVCDYLEHSIIGPEYFGDLLGGCYPRKKVMIDLSHLVAAFNGTSEYALSLLHELKPILDSKYDVTVHCTKRADDFFGLSGKYPRIWHAEDGINERYDIAFVPHQIFSTHHLFRLNRFALRLIVNVQDIIALRCQYLRRPDIESALRLSVGMADGVISVSQASLDDLRCYLGDGGFRLNQDQRVIHHAYPDPEQDKSAGQETGLPEKGFIRLRSKPLPSGSGGACRNSSLYATADSASEAAGVVQDTASVSWQSFIFLVGNNFDHKAVDMALENLPDSSPIVVLGGKQRRPQGHVRFFKSGELSSQLIDSLYDRCSAVIFPSQYEGFGLPFLQAAQRGKPVIAYDSETTREVTEAFGIGSLVYRFGTFRQIPGLLEQALTSVHQKPAHRRSWREVAEETADFISSVVDCPVDLEFLNRRFVFLNAMERTGHQHDFRAIVRSIVTRPWRLAVRKLKRAAEPVLELFGR